MTVRGKRVSERERARREEQSWRAKGGELLPDGAGGFVDMTPVRGGYRVNGGRKNTRRRG